MKYGCTLIAVTDMERSKQFYHDVLGLDVTLDVGANVTLTGNIALQTSETWTDFINGKDISFGGNTFELYFEEDDIGGFMEKLNSMPEIELVHPLLEHSWGQRAIRFYDPDRHIIEVGENMDIVVKRFLQSGLSVEEAAKRMDVPVEYVQERV